MADASTSAITMSAVTPLHGKKLTQQQIEFAGTAIFSTLFILSMILAAIVWYLASSGYKTAAVVVGCYFGSGILSSALVSGDGLFYADTFKDHIYITSKTQ